MGQVVHFEIPADDLERVQKFYQDVFGWKPNPMPDMGYVIVHTGPVDDKQMPKEKGYINGGMMKRDATIKNPVITIAVENIDEITKTIASRGGKIIRPKMDVGDMGYAAYFQDTEGNIIGLWQVK